MKTYKTYILISLLLIISCAPNTNNTKNESDFQFEVKILDQNLNEPMEFDIFDNDEIIFIERSGYIKLYDPKIEKTKIITKFDVEMSSDTTNDKTPFESAPGELIVRSAEALPLGSHGLSFILDQEYRR